MNKQGKIHKNKQVISFVLSFIMVFSFVSGLNVYAVDTVKVQYNGEIISFNKNFGTPFIDENNRTQVPFRLTLETIGAKVTWNQQTLTATAIRDDVRVDVPIGAQFILKNGEKILNDTTSRIIDDRTYLPIRIVLEAFGSDVSWNAETYTVIVTYEEEQNLFTTIPKKYDLRSTGKVTEVKNQFATGACWAFASFGAIESALMPQEYWDFSEDHLSLGHGFNLDQADGGNYAISLSYLTRWSGPVREEEDVFNDGVNNADAVPVKHIQEVQFIPNKDYSGIKVELMAYGGVQTSIFLDDVSLSASGPYYNKELATYNYFGNQKINHDVVIVGWDDNYPKENFKGKPKRNGAFIVKNSYGKDFGKDGYFYVSYDDKHIGKQNVVFTRIDDVDNYDHIYQTDWLGYIGQIGYGEDTAYFSNVYKSRGKELLKAVGFYATDENSTYEVYVVPEFTSTKNYQKMTLVDRGSFNYGGYYTVDFESPIVVDGTYSVVVKITTPNSSFPVAAEFMKDEPWLNNVDTSDGQGYMSYDGHTWSRAETDLDANVCLKAYTWDYDITMEDGAIPLNFN